MGERHQKRLHGLDNLAVEVLLQAKVVGGVAHGERPGDGGRHIGDEIEFDAGKPRFADREDGEHTESAVIVDQRPGTAGVAAGDRGEPIKRGIGLIEGLERPGGRFVQSRGAGGGPLAHQSAASCGWQAVAHHDGDRGNTATLAFAANPNQAVLRILKEQGAAVAKKGVFANTGFDLQFAQLPQQLISLDIEGYSFRFQVHASWPLRVAYHGLHAAHVWRTVAACHMYATVLWDLCRESAPLFSQMHRTCPYPWGSAFCPSGEKAESTGLGHGDKKGRQDPDGLKARCIRTAVGGI